MNVTTAEQSAWALLPPQGRIVFVQRARRALSEALPSWVKALTETRGCSRVEALSTELIPLLDAHEFLERCAVDILTPKRPGKRWRPLWLTGVELEIRRQPWGKILILGPGNYPLFLPAVQALQALVAGNSVLLKPQVGCESLLQKLVQLWQENGLPIGLIDVLDSDPRQVHGLLKQVDKVVVTGSLDTGRALLTAAAPRLIPVTAELSGADLVWLGPEADVGLAAQALRWGLTLNRGNTCMAPRRVLASPATLADLEGLLSAPCEGLPDNEEIALGARWIAPGFLSRVPFSSPLWQHEEGRDFVILGAVESDQAGLEVANRCSYGLGAALFGHPGWAARISRQLQVGFVSINDLIAPSADPRLPFGGRKGSGSGVTRGAEGLLEMTVPQAVSERKQGPYYHFDSPSPHTEAILANYARFSHGAGGFQRALSLARMTLAAAREQWRRRREKP